MSFGFGPHDDGCQCPRCQSRRIGHTQIQLQAAFATVTHAILYVGEDEPIAIGILKLARRAIYDEKLVFTRYAQWTHFCEKCPRYKDAPR